MKVAISLHRGFMFETQKKITEDINEIKQTESHATWIAFSFEIRGTTKFVLQRPVRKVENWNSKLTSYL